MWEKYILEIQLEIFIYIRSSYEFILKYLEKLHVPFIKLFPNILRTFLYSTTFLHRILHRIQACTTVEYNYNFDI